MMVCDDLPCYTEDPLLTPAPAICSGLPVSPDAFYLRAGNYSLDVGTELPTAWQLVIYTKPEIQKLMEG